MAKVYIIEDRGRGESDIVTGGPMRDHIILTCRLRFTCVSFSFRAGRLQ